MNAVIRSLVGLAILLCSLWFMDWATLKKYASEIPLELFILATVISSLQFFILAVRWHYLVKKMSSLGLLGHFSQYCYATFLNMFTPANFGGDVYRFLSLRNKVLDRAAVVAVLVKERLLGLATYFAGCVTFLFAASLFRSADGRTGGIFRFIGLVAAAGMVFIALLPIAGERLIALRCVKSRVRLVKVAEIVRGVWSFDSVGHFLMLFSLSLVALGIWICTAMIVNLGLSIDLTLSSLGIVVVVAEIARLSIPISIQGVGVREGAYAFLFGSLGYPAEGGFVLGAVTYLALTMSMWLVGSAGWCTRRIIVRRTGTDIVLSDGGEFGRKTCSQHGRSARSTKSALGIERLDLAQITLQEIYPSAGRLAWAEKLEMTWPVRIITALMESPGDPICVASYENRRVVLRKPVSPPVNIRKIIETVRETTSYSSRPVQSRMPFSYQSVPFQLRWWIAALLVRFNRANRRGVMAFPTWPLDLSLDSLADLAQELEGASDRAHGVHSRWVVLTHDIDTKESLKNLPRFLDIEREFRARSTNFVVPCGWRLDHELLGDVLASGNEIGIHGYDHSNRTAFLPPAEIRRRLESSRDFAERYHARGYRAPSLLRTPRLIEALAGFVDYDASVPNVDGFYSSRPGGCATSRPYRHLCGLAEIPLTLPSDANLLFQGFSPDEILSLWKKLALLILRSGGVVTILTHCEERYSGNRGMHGIYSQFLDFIGSSCLGSWKTMGDVANSVDPEERSQSLGKK